MNKIQDDAELLRHHFITKCYKWATTRQNQHNDMCAQQRLRSAFASAQSDQSLRYALNG